MNLQKLTLKSQQALQTAQEIAGGYSNQQIEPIHILAAMLQDSAGIVPPMLMKIGANLNYLKIKVNESIESLPKVSGAGLGSQYISQYTGRMIESALKEATAMGDEYVSTEHLLIAISEDKTSPAGALLRACLPVAGQSGTLAERFTGTDLVGRVRAKTGWIRGASALSGMLERADGSVRYFSILMNYDPKKDGLNRDLKRLQEDIVRAIDRGEPPR